jgi:hypothetical protein
MVVKEANGRPADTLSLAAVEIGSMERRVKQLVPLLRREVERLEKLLRVPRISNHCAGICG